MNILKQRQIKVCKLMKEKELKAIILSPSVNMSYLTGFSTSFGERFFVSILFDTGEIVFIVPKLYEQEVRERVNCDRILSWEDSQNPVEFLEKIAEEYELEECNISIEDTMWYLSFEKISKNLNEVCYSPASEIVGEVRAVKSKSELEKMRKASELSDLALNNTIKKIKVGMREVEVKEALENEMNALGLIETSFNTIIGSGSNSALPHHTAGDRVLQQGDAVVIDFGGVYEGYCSDMTRTFVIGEYNEEFKKVYEIVKEAQTRATNAVKPGIKASEIDKIARNYIKEKGYGEYFVHRTGHSIGLEVHENPSLSDIDNSILSAGMVFSIEPGIYIPEKFGVRIEDSVIVTEEGVEVINKFSKELKII